MKFNLNCNDIIFIIIFLFIILLILLKSINIHFKFKETFENNNNNENKNNSSESIEKEINNEMGNIENTIKEAEDEISEDTEDDMTTAELEKKCSNLGNKKYGAIVSKYSGRMINVEFVEEGNDPNPNLSVNSESKNSYLYLVKWKPLGNKPGGCITCNANGTYSTPMCDSTLQNQLWHIVYIKNREDLEKIIPPKYQKFGRDMDKTEFPFSIILSAKYNSNRYVLNYEGGGLSIRPIANYDGIRWDVSEEGIKQELLPSQNNSKYTSLTPEHNMTKSDNSLNKFFEKTKVNTEVKNDKENGDGKGLNFNINLDPDLLQQLGLGLNGIGSGNMNNNLGIDLNSNSNSNSNNSNNSNNTNNSNNGLSENTDLNEEADLLLTQEELDRRKNQQNQSGGRGNVNDMIMEGANQDPCNNCGKVPPNYIKKDLVKSMCIGCNDIDNVST